jgi:hypothetical protein
MNTSTGCIQDMPLQTRAHANQAMGNAAAANERRRMQAVVNQHSHDSAFDIVNGRNHDIVQRYLAGLRRNPLPSIAHNTRGDNTSALRLVDGFTGPGLSPMGRIDSERESGRIEEHVRHCLHCIEGDLYDPRVYPDHGQNMRILREYRRMLHDLLLSRPGMGNIDGLFEDDELETLHDMFAPNAIGRRSVELAGWTPGHHNGHPNGHHNGPADGHRDGRFGHW